MPKTLLEQGNRFTRTNSANVVIWTAVSDAQLVCDGKHENADAKRACDGRQRVQATADSITGKDIPIVLGEGGFTVVSKN